MDQTVTLQIARENVALARAEVVTLQQSVRRDPRRIRAAKDQADEAENRLWLLEREQRGN